MRDTLPPCFSQGPRENIKARCHAPRVPALVRDTLPPCLFQNRRQIQTDTYTDATAAADTVAGTDTDTDTDIDAVDHFLTSETQNRRQYTTF